MALAGIEHRVRLAQGGCHGLLAEDRCDSPFGAVNDLLRVQIGRTRDAHDLGTLVLEHGNVVLIGRLNLPAPRECGESIRIGVGSGDERRPRMTAKAFRMSDGQDLSPRVAAELVHEEAANGSTSDQCRPVRALG